MNKKIYLLPILLLALVFVSCEETKEVSIYDNWQERNEAFIDSLRNEFMTNREVSGLDTIHLLSAPDDYIFYKESGRYLRYHFLESRVCTDVSLG